MLKKVKKKLNNKGNSFIMVVASLSFLAIITAALLVAVALCYRLKIMDINSRDNFYYLEQAMDEIYAGVGTDSMVQLNEAYTETLEVIVYFDTESKSYVTMENDVANELLRTNYMKKIKDEDGYYGSKDKALARIRSFITNPAPIYNADGSVQVAGDPEGVSCTIDNIDLSKKEKDNLTILNLTLSRTAEYSTMTVGTKGASDQFTQTISTDLVIGVPDFNVSFNTIDSSMNSLFSFSMLADKGIEIENAKVNITGDVYAAADFYNKDYNGDSSRDVSKTVDAQIEKLTLTDESGNAISDAARQEIADMYKIPVCSYDSSDSRYTQQDGANEKSMYSGIYMSNSDVVMTSNKIIVPGTIAAMNVSNLTVSAISGNTVSKSEIWTDSIVLGGYAMKRGGDDYVGSDVSLNAKCYVSDDVEVNATSSKLTLIGEYYGYNNSTTDTRSFTSAFLKKNGVFDNRNWDEQANNGNGGYQTGQAHYNSSSLIMNGEDSTLDLKDVSAMYIAGQAYVELSKKTEQSDAKVEYQTIDQAGNQVADEETVEVNTYTYTYDKDEFTSKSDGTDMDAIQDYKTGEAVSIKSNQLAYIPPSAIQQDSKGNYYVTLNDTLLESELFKKFWPDSDDGKKALSEIPVVKTVISGKTYHFFDLSNLKDKDGKPLNLDANDFIAAYSKVFETDSPITTYLTDITNYEDFQVEALILPKEIDTNETDYTRIYSNSALTVKTGTTFSIKADNKAIAALLSVADTINENDSIKAGAEQTTINKTATTDSEMALMASNITTELQNQYKEMKLLLTNQSVVANDVAIARAMDESAITPINHFFKFSIFGKKYRVDSMAYENFNQSGYGVWTNKGDLEVKANNAKGVLKGIIICKGDLTFDSSVKSFEGLIVCGGKIKVTHDIDFVANQEVVKSVLRVCENNQDDTTTQGKECKHLLMLFRNYGGSESQDDIINVDNSESTRTITTIQFEDILSFDNWKKNVD